ncbi:MAG: NAD(P)-binding domain-containing protein, partial [Marinilabiliales bacterium]|nr:NAD(P)-binding domain-containing protein [Marinilabiliales bacterium]
MDQLLTNLLVYGSVTLFILVTVGYYLFKQSRDSRIVNDKIVLAKQMGLYEPVTLHPVIDVNSCIKSGACIKACPEKDIIGISNGKATIINASRCIGHGACFHACPVQAISLCIGTEKRGVDLPHVDASFESNVRGIYIAGEMGGMGLIRNSVEQGKQAVENLSRKLDRGLKADFDLVIVGAGPAGIAASLMARKNKLKALLLEQDSLGGTILTYPRAKIVMTSAMDLPLYGKVKLHETNKMVLLDLWKEVISTNGIDLREKSKVVSITQDKGVFAVKTIHGETFLTRNVLLAIGRRGSPRKLGVPGEESSKVAYKLMEPETIQNNKILVVGGGDSAIESALLLANENQVTLSYRGDAFSRIKAKNSELLQDAQKNGTLKVILSSQVTAIEEHQVTLVNL